jgi:hypothetical protein
MFVFEASHLRQSKIEKPSAQKLQDIYVIWVVILPKMNRVKSEKSDE